MPAGISASDFYYILPELVLTAGALLVLIADVLLPRGSKLLAWVTLAARGATRPRSCPFPNPTSRWRTACSPSISSRCSSRWCSSARRRSRC